MGNIFSVCADDPILPDEEEDVYSPRFTNMAVKGGDAKQEIALVRRELDSHATNSPSNARSRVGTPSSLRRSSSRSDISKPVVSHAQFTERDPVRDPRTGGICTPLEEDFYVTAGIGSVVGDGAYGIVRKVKHIRTKRIYAVKTVLLESDAVNAKRPDYFGMRKGDKKLEGDGSGADGSNANDSNANDCAISLLREKKPCALLDVVDEIHLSMQLAHPNVVNVYDFYQTDTEVHIVMEYLQGGSLLDVINDIQNASTTNDTIQPFSERDAAFMMKNVLTALEHLHENNVTHRDVKLENIMFAVRGDYRTVRVVDFGLAFKAKSSREKMSAQCGSPGYIAPEIVHGTYYSSSVDVWAGGCVFFAMMNGTLPFEEEKVKKTYRRIVKCDHQGFLGSVSDEAKSFTKKMLEIVDANRVTAAEALEDPFIIGHVHGPDAILNGWHTKKSRAARFVELNYMRLGGIGTRVLNAGEVLITKGKRALEVFVIDEGCVEILVHDETSGEEVKVAERGVGDVVGEMGVKTEPFNDGDTAKHDAREKKEVELRRRLNTPLTPEKQSSLGLKKLKRGERLHPIHLLVVLLRVKRVWFGGRRGAEVRTVTKTRVSVLTNKQYRAMLAEDYGVDAERKKMIETRTQETADEKQKASDVRRASLDERRVDLDLSKEPTEKALDTSPTSSLDAYMNRPEDAHRNSPDSPGTPLDLNASLNAKRPGKIQVSPARAG